MDKNRSMVDVAYELMSKKKKAVNFYKLWQEVSEVKGFDEEEKDENQFHIWSSSTLYSKEIREQRKVWFTNFIQENNNPTPEEILYFHQFTEAENKEFGLQINRNAILKTISITQCKVTNDKIEMIYLDLFE